MKTWKIMLSYYFSWAFLLGVLYLVKNGEAFSLLLVALFYCLLLKVSGLLFTISIPDEYMEKFYKEIGSSSILIGVIIFSFATAVLLWLGVNDTSLVAGMASLAIFFGEKYLISIILKRKLSR